MHPLTTTNLGLFMDQLHERNPLNRFALYSPHKPLSGLSLDLVSQALSEVATVDSFFDCPMSKTPKDPLIDFEAFENTTKYVYGYHTNLIL